MCYIEASNYIHCRHMNVHFWTCTNLEHGHLRPKSIMHSYHRLCPACFKEKYVRVEGERVEGEQVEGERVEAVDETAVESESEDRVEEVPTATRPPPTTTTESRFRELMARRGWTTMTPIRQSTPTRTSTEASERPSATSGDEVAPAAETPAAWQQLQEQAAIGLRRRRLAVLRQSPDIGDAGRSLLAEREWDTMTDTLLADAAAWPAQIQEARGDLASLIGAREQAQRMSQPEHTDVGMLMQVVEARLLDHLEDAARAWYILLTARSSRLRFSQARPDSQTIGVGTERGLIREEVLAISREGGSSNVSFGGAARLSHPHAVVSARVTRTLEELVHPGQRRPVDLSQTTSVSIPSAEISGRVATTWQQRVETSDTGVLRATQEEQAPRWLLQAQRLPVERERQQGRAAVGQLIRMVAERSVRSGETAQARVNLTFAAVAEDQMPGLPRAQRRGATQGVQTSSRRRRQADRPIEQRRPRRRPFLSPQGRGQDGQEARQLQQVLHDQLTRVRALDRRNNRMCRMLETEILQFVEETTRNETRASEVVRRHLRDLRNNTLSDVLRQEYEELLRQRERGLERLGDLSRLAVARLGLQQPFRARQAEEGRQSGRTGQYSLVDIERRLGVSLARPNIEIAIQEIPDYERARARVRSMRNLASTSPLQPAQGQGEDPHLPGGQSRPSFDSGGGDIHMVSREKSPDSPAEGEFAAVGSNPENPGVTEQGQLTAPDQIVSNQGIDVDDQVQPVVVVQEAAQSTDPTAVSAQNHGPEDNATIPNYNSRLIIPRPSSRSSRRLLRWTAFETQER